VKRILVLGLLVAAGLVWVGKTAAGSISLSEQSEFTEGVLSGVEAESLTGALKLKSADEWEQRGWRTPDVALTTGTAVGSDGEDVYVIAGGTTWFARYSPDANDWEVLSPAPSTAYYGSDLVYLDGYIYAIFGNYQNIFARYNIASNSWESRENTPDLVYRGGSLATDGTNIYALRGYSTTDFWRYSVALDDWSTITSTPATMYQGASLVYDNGYLYSLRGSNTTTFYRYDISAGTWTTRTVLPVNLNDDSQADIRDGYIYVLLNNATTTMYRYSISGNSWSAMTATPQAARYVGLTYNSGDDTVYVFRGNGSYDFWKYDADANSYTGPATLSSTPGSGADLVYYNGYLYHPRGNNSTTFYRYNISGNSWESRAVAPGQFNDDVRGAVAGVYLYFLRGSSTNSFYRYDPALDSWTTLTNAYSTAGNGAGLVYPGSGDYIYATRGLSTRSFWKYSITGQSWDDDPADLPDNAEAAYGARLVSDGTDIYYLSGYRTGSLYKYTVLTNTWTEVTKLPYAPYWGTDAVYYNGEIYVQAGFYKNDVWRYNLTSGEWHWVTPLEQYYGYDAGQYNGGSLAFDTVNNVLYSISGANILDMASMALSGYGYLAEGTWTSATQDLTYVTSFGGLSVEETKPSDSEIGYETRTSADQVSWSEWAGVTAGVIASPANRYLQIRATLEASSTRTQTPTLESVTVSYTGDENPPDNPDTLIAKSAEVGGVTITSGTNYKYNYPYFSWSGAADSESAVSGYYVYFGTEEPDPEEEGSYQTGTDFVVTESLSENTYYLRIKTKDNAGNVSETWEAFEYAYQGVPETTVSYSSQAEFESGTLTNMSASGDELKLTSKAGYWMEEGLTLTPANLYYGSSIAYDSSNNKLYVNRGSNSNTFYEYNLATNAWATKTNAPATMGYGGEVVEGPAGYLYAFRGVNTNSFWRYDITQNAWDDAAATDSPQPIYYGSSLVYDSAQYIYALKGNNDDTFLRYDTTLDEWSSLTSVDFGAPLEQPNNYVHYGGDLAYDGADTIYAVQGNTRTGFAAYSITDDTWTQLPKTPAAVYQGGQIEYDVGEGAVYLIPGWGRTNFYKYDVASEEWEELAEGPYTFGLGTGMKNVNGKLYITRANNSRYFYSYDTTKDQWLVPTRGLFGTMFQGTDIRTIGYGADVVKGNENYLYMTRGNNDNLFVRYDTQTGGTTELSGVPSGQQLGGALSYNEDDEVIYAIASQYNKNFYVYSIAENTWSMESLDLLPIDPAAGASLEYDGERYVYYAPGGGSQAFYRFDTEGSAGSKWASRTNITAGVSYGAELVAKGGYIYTLRGNSVNPNQLYRYDPEANSWATLATVGAAIYNDGFLVDGGGDYLYACRGANTRSCYRYSITGNSWEAIADAPGEIYIGGAGASDLSGKMYVLMGSSGTSSFNNGIYTYVMQSVATSFERVGSYQSATIDLGEVYRYANLTLGYTTAEDVTLTVSTRTSSDQVTWESWSEATEGKTVDGSTEYKINSGVKQYLQILIEMESSEGVYSGTVSEYSVSYYSDTDLPLNPSELTAYSTATMSAELSTNSWYNFATPYFDWPEPETTGGASDTTTGSAIAGYYVYFGTESEGDPVSEGSYITTTSFTASSLISGSTYYLRMKTIDDAGNVSSAVWEPFIYKYDGTAPSTPTGVAADPSGYSSVNEFDFSWEVSTDGESEVVSYCYKTGTPSGTLSTDQCAASTSALDLTGYQTGTNTFYVRAKDAGGNYSAYATASYYFNNGAPSAPTNLTVTPEENTVNSFEFSWGAPTAYYGSLANLKYYYSVNALPTAASVTQAYSNSLGAAAYATLPGENTLYVVVMDEAGNIDYGSYASVTFSANTTAPGIPTNVDIADVSVKSTSSWKLAISWEEPTSVGAGVATYRIYRSTDGTSYTFLASTSGISYVDTRLAQQTYYYYVKACDSANNCGAEGSIVELYPDGKYTTPAPLVGEPDVSEITTKKATIEWTTSRTADSKIAYGTASGDYFTEEVGNSDQVTAHELELNNLEPGTTYYFVAKWTDEDGNLGTSEEYTFATEPAPTAKEVKAVAIGIDSASIQFTSSHASSAKVYYGVTSAFGGYTEMGVGTAESTYTVQLTGLADGTKYYYKISLFDSEENEYEGDVYSFETLPRPKIQAVKLQQVKGTATSTVLVTWTTNTPVSTIVTYYPSANPSASADSIDVKMATTHRKVIADLLPNTAYTLVVKGRDKAGNEALSPPQTFTTSADTRPPSVANLQVEAVIEGVGEEAIAQLVVSWDTDELSTSQVAYGEGSTGSMGSKTQEDASMTYNHLVVVPNLQPSKVYHLKVLSKDEAKNEAESVERVVITPKATKSALNLVVSNLSQAFGFLGGIAGE